MCQQRGRCSLYGRLRTSLENTIQASQNAMRCLIICFRTIVRDFERKFSWSCGLEPQNRCFFGVQLRVLNIVFDLPHSTMYSLTFLQQNNSSRILRSKLKHDDSVYNHKDHKYRRQPSSDDIPASISLNERIMVFVNHSSRLLNPNIPSNTHRVYYQRWPSSGSCNLDT